jgi:hypothetical protein
MGLTFRARKFVIFAVIALVLPAWAAGGLPLVWCVGSNGHSAVEAVGLGDCHDAQTSAFRNGKSSAEKADCTDFSLWQRAQAPREPVAGTSPPPDLAMPVALTVAAQGSSPCQLSIFCSRPDFVADQLAQHRTVVLLI